MTINTHTQFELDYSNVDPDTYRSARALLLKSFKGNTHAFDQFFRISQILKHISTRISENPALFDRILIIGDHANPDVRSRQLYNQEMVPYVVLHR